MQKENVQLRDFKLVGITCRTNNSIEINPLTGKISPTVQKYFHENLAERIGKRKNPGTTYCVYTNYESDFNGDYTYLIGEEVSDFQELPKGFSSLIIPAQNYLKFTNGPGAMPDVLINAWQKIWAMTPKDLGGERGYLADFEVYDERARDHQKTILDIYVGIK